MKPVDTVTFTVIEKTPINEFHCKCTLLTCLLAYCFQFCPVSGRIYFHGKDKLGCTDANMATCAQTSPRMKSDSQQTFNLSPLSQVRCWQRPRYLTKTRIGPQERDKLFVSAVNAANLVSHHFKFKSTAALRGSEKMCVHETRGERRGGGGGAW